MVSEKDWIWLAGWLEGEGCFHIQKSKSNNYPRISVGIHNKDRDVIEGAYHRFGGVGHLYEDKKRNIIFWTVSNAPDVWMMCRELLPFMGQRRSSKIVELLAILEHNQTRIKNKRCQLFEAL